ncbi:hypothetical protein PFISCL1PPCAC_19291, partial [Pristionchus fissidentatus]
MGNNGEEPAVECVQPNGRCQEEDAEHAKGRDNDEREEDKKKSDAILDELFSSIQQAGTVVDVAEAITEDSKSRRERATRDKSRSRSRSRDRKHKHKKNKKEKKHRRHRSRSRSNDRKKRHRSNSSSPCRIGKTGTLADIKINTKSKNLDDLKNAVPVSYTNIHHDDDDDELPVGADYRTVMAEAVASSSPSTSHGPSLADLPTAKKLQPAFPLKKSDGEKTEKRDPIEEKGSPMLKKVISEKGGALLVPRKIQIDSSKNNGSAASDSFGPALPPPAKEEEKEEEEEVKMNTGVIKLPSKITFGHISLKVNADVAKKEEGNGEEKVEEKKEERKEEKKEKEEKKGKHEKSEKNDDKEKKAAKKMAVRRRRSSSVEASKRKEKKERERKRSRSRSKERRVATRDRSRYKFRDHRRDRSRSKDRRDRKDDRSILPCRRRSRSRSVDRRRDDRAGRDRDRRSGRSRSRERRCSRERERSKSREKIDKKKLLEIALQNSKGVAGPVAEKQGVNLKILEKAGGKNIGDIVSYCQKLSETENAEKVHVGGRGDSDDDDFSYRNKKEIKLNIPGSKQLPTSTPQERLLDTAPLRTAFPVSSGVIHRDNTKEASVSEWKKVDASSVIPSVCTPAQKKLIATSSMTRAKAESEGKTVPLPNFPILPPPPAPPKIRGDLIPPPPPPPVFLPSTLMPPPPMPPTIITPSNDRLIQMPDSGYEEDSRSLRRRMEDRSKAVNRLISDPNDTDAMRKLREIDDALNDFGKTAELSGKWMGHTRVSLLSGDELQPHDPRFHAWVKKDLFKNTLPVVGGVGATLMKKMGWTPGEGLGRERQGDTQPLVLDVKSDRKGLYSEMYDMPMRGGKSKGTKKAGGKGGGGGGERGGGGGGGGGDEIV